jgi:hypothetical protein
VRHATVSARAALWTATLLLAGCASKATFPVRTYPLGEKVTLGNLVYTVFESDWLTHLGELGSGRIPQNRFLLVRVSITNSGGNPVLVPNLTAEDDAGHSYPELSDGNSVPQWIGYLRQIRPADSANGNVLFDVPPAHFKLRIQDEEGQRAALIDIPLSFNSETPDIPTPDRK